MTPEFCFWAVSLWLWKRARGLEEKEGGVEGLHSFLSTLFYSSSSFSSNCFFFSSPLLLSIFLFYNSVSPFHLFFCLMFLPLSLHVSLSFCIHSLLTYFSSGATRHRLIDYVFTTSPIGLSACVCVSEYQSVEADTGKKGKSQNGKDCIWQNPLLIGSCIIKQ